MVSDEEKLFAELHYSWHVINDDFTNELVNEGYLNNEYNITSKSKEFISTYYNKKKEFVLKAMEEDDKDSLDIFNIKIQTEITDSFVMELILRYLTEEGKLNFKKSID